MHTNGDTKRQGKGERTTETREKRQRRENQEIKEQRHVSNDRYRGERKREADLCFHPCIPIAFGQSCKTVDTTLMPEMHIELNRIASTPLSTAILLASAGESSAEMNHCGAHVAQQEAERHACVCVSPQDRMCAWEDLQSADAGLLQTATPSFSKQQFNWVSRVIQTVNTHTDRAWCATNTHTHTHTLYTQPMSQKTKLRKIYKSCTTAIAFSMSLALPVPLSLSPDSPRDNFYVAVTRMNELRREEEVSARGRVCAFCAVWMFMPPRVSSRFCLFFPFVCLFLCSYTVYTVCMVCDCAPYDRWQPPCEDLERRAEQGTDVFLAGKRQRNLQQCAP